MKDWFKSAVVYQVYPRSFMDSNGDGIGDLQGIHSKVDYLKSLGINTLWLCPIYPSPNDDNGYDVSDYLGIHPDFGNLQDFAELTAKLKSEGIRLILDMVLNHSSDEHQWFQESRTSKPPNSYSDYYIWHPSIGEDSTEKPIPPNNWTSIFGGSAWKWCQERREFYLHLFSEKQPDLNWENPRVREELFEVCRTWARRGVDGFRLDVINLISKKKGFPDVPDSLLHSPDQHYSCGPRIHEFLKELHQEVFAPFGSMSVGETPGIDSNLAALYCARERSELNMIFGFDHMCVDHGPGGIWDPAVFRFEQFFSILSHWQEQMQRYGGWNSLYVENHDQARFISRMCKQEEFLNEAAGLVATLLLTLKGTPYIYQGQEIGMRNVAYQSIEDYHDIWTLNHYRDSVESGDRPSEVLRRIHYRSRDNARTPMQWNCSENSGFTNGKPWIKVSPSYPDVNIENAQTDLKSPLHVYRSLIEIKQNDPVFIEGKFQRLESRLPGVFAYLRGERRLIVLNFNAIQMPIGDLLGANTKLVFSSQRDSCHGPLDKLQPYEGRIYS